MKGDLRRPCSECPFRRASAPGWMGPWSPKELLASIAYYPFACHKTIPEGAGEVDPNEAPLRELQLCAGAAIFLNNQLKLSRSPVAAAHQTALKGVDEAVKRGVFGNAAEFLDHHTIEPKGE